VAPAQRTERMAPAAAEEPPPSNATRPDVLLREHVQRAWHGVPAGQRESVCLNVVERLLLQPGAHPGLIVELLRADYLPTQPADPVYVGALLAVGFIKSLALPPEDGTAAELFDLMLRRFRASSAVEASAFDRIGRVLTPELLRFIMKHVGADDAMGLGVTRLADHVASACLRLAAQHAEDAVVGPRVWRAAVAVMAARNLGLTLRGGDAPVQTLASVLRQQPAVTQWVYDDMVEAFSRRREAPALVGLPLLRAYLMAADSLEMLDKRQDTLVDLSLGAPVTAWSYRLFRSVASYVTGLKSGFTAPPPGYGHPQILEAALDHLFPPFIDEARAEAKIPWLLEKLIGRADAWQLTRALQQATRGDRQRATKALQWLASTVLPRIEDDARRRRACAQIAVIADALDVRVHGESRRDPALKALQVDERLRAVCGLLLEGEPDLQRVLDVLLSHPSALEDLDVGVRSELVSRLALALQDPERRRTLLRSLASDKRTRRVGPERAMVLIADAACRSRAFSKKELRRLKRHCSGAAAAMFDTEV
ncbi:MAG TPA: hypothetical protein VFH51_19080, partial [Myxococcota bacterium]|nr:hypothetical protein [Myxococcota bacterium]